MSVSIELDHKVHTMESLPSPGLHSLPSAHHCHTCPLQSRCVPSSLNLADLEQFDRIIHRGRPLRRGEHLYMAADPFRSIYMILQGTIKTYCLTEDGDEQVTGFLTTGDCFGFDGLNIMKHTNSAKALDRTQVCEIPFERLEQLCRRIPSLQHYAYQLASRQILQEQKLLQFLGKRSAEARVAYLLLNFIGRANHDHPLTRPIQLPMTRYDTANYLGLSVETVSRILSRMQQLGIIRLRGRLVAIQSPSALTECAQVETNVKPVRVMSL